MFDEKNAGERPVTGKRNSVHFPLHFASSVVLNAKVRFFASNGKDSKYNQKNNNVSTYN